PQGTISVGVDATDLFDRYDEDYEEIPGGGFPHIEINRMHISQSIELELGAGDTHGPLFGMKMFRNLTPRWSVPVLHIALLSGSAVSSHSVRPGLTTLLARHLDKNTMGYLQWRWGTQSAMNTSIVRDTKSSHLTFALQLGIPHCFMMLSYQYKFQDEDQTKVKGSLKAGFFGTVLEYGVEQKISRHSVLGATVSVGVPQGVSLKIKLNRASQTYFFPMHLTDQLLPSAVFYATVGPLVFFLAMQRLVIQPYLSAQKEQELEKQRESSSSDIARKKQEAEAAVSVRLSV
ncbi:DJC11 protein, partial [Polyodon spathula]|nr:DJC11 protein [Polyodon spathula]